MAVRCGEVIALRLPQEVVRELKAGARRDDRALGTYLRRLILSTVNSDGNHENNAAR